ncbi:chromate transporter [Mucilaginibacter humi]|uniref:chromate transporter n=1 Tax=Mucilaginibacter humi TaxID=2732510 RepID=UPI00293B9B08|nr:chromate transporter [Mucilaginibacter humi]
MYTLSAFGGPQGHIAIMLREFVQKRQYITEEELMELNAPAQVLLARHPPKPWWVLPGRLVAPGWL